MTDAKPNLLRRALTMLLLPLMVVIVFPWLLRNSFAASDTSWVDLRLVQGGPQEQECAHCPGWPGWAEF